MEGKEDMKRRGEEIEEQGEVMRCGKMKDVEEEETEKAEI